MSEPILPIELSANAAEHAEFRVEIARITRALSEVLTGRGAPRLAHSLDALRTRLLRHFEHEELSWSALGERLGSHEFCAWTAEYTAQHRELAARAAELVDELARQERAGPELLPEQAIRLEQLFHDLLEHERGETHLLARQAGGEDEGWSER